MIKKVMLALSLPILLFSEDLNDLINMSLKNKNIMATEKNVESVQDEYKSVKKGYLPNVSVGAAYTDVDRETSSYANNSMNAYVDISYSLYDGGKKDLTYKSYESQINASKEELNTLKNEVSLDVINHYFNYLTYVSQKEAKITQIEQLTAQYQRLSKFLDAGATTIDELDRIMSNLESAKVELHELDLNIETVLHELEYITGKRVDISNGSYLEVSSEEGELRNDIKTLEYEAKTKFLDAKTVKTDNMPKVSLDNTYSYYDYNYNSSTYQNSAIDHQNVFSVNLKWDLFDFGSTKAAYDSKHKSFLSSKSKLEYEKNKASIDLNLAIKSYEIAKLKIKSANAALRAAVSTYDVVKNKYENGLVDNVSYLEALSDKSDAQSALSSAKYNLEVRKANVMYQKGKNVWEYVK
ncbi:TolC family protein [Poseidonibacter antarcticus]|uniref:TolC family protein n=1 Tax=Poseidonibacter antarcticus TaxID=2478538 RepID=UPI001D17F16E|nr:TolC family protein [Poseidonibacter antarcticus]